MHAGAGGNGHYDARASAAFSSGYADGGREPRALGGISPYRRQPSRASGLSVFPIQRVEETLLLQADEELPVDIFAGIPAHLARELRHHILGALPDRLDIERRHRGEVVIADLDDLGIGDAGLLRQY